MISSRYAWSAFLLLLLTLFPTISNFYRGLPVLKEQKVIALPGEIAGMKGVSTNRNGSRIQNVFHTEDWVERVYTDKSGKKVTLFVARGFDGRPFFHFPERGLLQRDWYDRIHEDLILKGESNPVNAHMLRLVGVNENKRVLYVLLYGNEAVGNPYLFLLRRIPWMFLGGREPFTLIFASCQEDQGSEDVKGIVESLLMATLDNLYSQNAGM